jgi:hypothetical protein
MSISNSNLPDSLIHLQDFIQQTDNDGSLKIISYKYCHPSSDSQVKKCRGLVYDGDRVLFPSLGYTDEYLSNQEIPLSSTSLQESYIFPSYEGTLLRIFYHTQNQKWYVSTHRKLDAHHSRWLANETFGDQFEKLIVEMTGLSYRDFFESLDRNDVYLFLLRPEQKNRLISNAPSETNERLLHVCTIRNRETFDFDHSIKSVSKPYRLRFSSIDELKQYVEHVDFHQQQGVIIFYQNNSNICSFKLMNSTYQEYANVRGNERNLLIRYLQVRHVPSYYKMLLEIYPERSNEFYTYDAIILQIAKHIHHAYVQRFVYKQYVVVSPLEYQIIKDCHAWHITDREHNKVTLIHVLQTLSKQDYVPLLNALVKLYLN